MTGHKTAIGKASITPDGKVKLKPSTYKQRNKALRTARKAKAWAEMSKKTATKATKATKATAVIDGGKIS